MQTLTTVTTGEKLRAAIRRRFGKTSLSHAAIELEIPKGNLSDWLKGHHEPSLESLRALSEKLNCKASSLVGDETPNPEPRKKRAS